MLAFPCCLSVQLLCALSTAACLLYRATFGKLKELQLQCAPVAQLDRATGYEPVGRAFESLRAHHLLPL
jgi:hypothetical protein